MSIERQCPLEALADIVACPDNVRLARTRTCVQRTSSRTLSAKSGHPPQLDKFSAKRVLFAFQE